MRNSARVTLFDVLVPAVALGAVWSIGVFLGWPLWWVSVASILGLLIIEGVLLNYVLFRRDGVTLGTDDDGPGLRLAAVAVMTVAVVAAVLVGYFRLTVPERQMDADSNEVVRLATAVSEATATFTPDAPTASIERAAELMAPEQAEAFKANFAKSTEELARKRITAQAQTVSAGVEAIAPDAASVAVVMRASQSAPGQAQSRAVLALRVTLAKPEGRWLVVNVAPITQQPQ